MEAVDAVIKELNAYGKQTVIVFNKIDNLADQRDSRNLREKVSRQRRNLGANRRGSGQTGAGIARRAQCLAFAFAISASGQ